MFTTRATPSDAVTDAGRLIRGRSASRAAAGGGDAPRPRISRRRCLRLVRCLRSVARRVGPGAPPRRYEVLVRRRALAVRDDLLRIAALLEGSVDPEPTCVAELQRLLTDGCESPLLNPNVHASELYATVHHVLAELEAAAASRAAATAT
jgi:hypothetical protein